MNLGPTAKDVRWWESTGSSIVGGILDRWDLNFVPVSLDAKKKSPNFFKKCFFNVPDWAENCNFMHHCFWAFLSASIYSIVHSRSRHIHLSFHQLWIHSFIFQLFIHSSIPLFFTELHQMNRLVSIEFFTSVGIENENLRHFKSPWCTHLIFNWQRTAVWIFCKSIEPDSYVEKKNYEVLPPLVLTHYKIILWSVIHSKSFQWKTEKQVSLPVAVPSLGKHETTLMTEDYLLTITCHRTYLMPDRPANRKVLLSVYCFFV